MYSGNATAGASPAKWHIQNKNSTLTALFEFKSAIFPLISPLRQPNHNMVLLVGVTTNVII